MVLTIIKRNGNREEFDTSKIKKAISWACIGTDSNPIELESKVHLKIQDGMSTSQVQETLINTALAMTNLDNFKNLNWRFVASKLKLLNLYKIAKREQGYDEFGYGPYYTFLEKAVKKGLYDKQILKEYSKDEILEMEKELKMEYDYGYDYAGMNLLASRYLVKKGGNIFELPQHMYMSISLLLALPEKNRLDFAKKIYHTIAQRKISLATPILLNLRRPHGNLASCFITAMDDSLNSIYYTLDKIAQISKNAGGVGVNISRLRSHGAYIKGYKGASGGVLPWVKLINDTAVAVNQLGSRLGAVTVALDVWHRDIQEFLEMQTENGDHRKKSFDVFPQIVIPDLFMRRVEQNADWTLVDPHEIRTVYGVELAELYGKEFEELYEKIETNPKLEFKNIVSAKKLFVSFLKTVVETGMPYVFYKDTVNKLNPNPHSGMIGNANLCVESYSNFSPTKVNKKILNGKMIESEVHSGETHTCNLVSINLSIVDENNVVEVTKTSVRILDNTIELTKPPVPEAQLHNDQYRILGIGFMGLADYLVKKGTSYEKGDEIVSNLFEKAAYAGIEASSELALKRGPYPKYTGSNWEKGIFFGKDKEWFEKNSKLNWEKLITKVKKQGMRNGGLFAIAPNTSTSLLLGSSASILPIYKKFFIDKGRSGAVPICPPHLNQDTFWRYKENQHIDQQHVINIVSKIQEWTDQGISTELMINMNNGVNAKTIYDMYVNAWQKKLKTVYYIRSITTKVSSAESDNTCVSCAN